MSQSNWINICITIFNLLLYVSWVHLWRVAFREIAEEFKKKGELR